MRSTITIVIVMITLNVLAQNQPSKWSFNFNYQNDSYIPKPGTEPPKAFGTSSFRGWTAGIDRTLYQKKYLKLNAGLSLNKKTQIMAGSRFVDPFTRAPEKGLDYYYLSMPIILQYVKSKVIQPSITITPGFQVFNRGEINDVTRFHRPPTGNFLQIMPGADIRLSDRLKIFVGGSLNRYDFFWQ
ncbi:MAG: hypothetical protein IPL46_13980 [Saprospiraceae bacterium]|nr:hypothetical protein [Saprospiraceae bacterium]